MKKVIKVILVVGTRPNYMKAAPIFNEIKKYAKNFQISLVHTGQHYDFAMCEIFFRDLKLPKPDVYLNVGSGTHAEQTGKILIRFENILKKEKPDLVIVVGDVNSTLACALTAKKLNIKIAHIEAGLRSFNMSMPEEVNRVLTDHISDYLFVTERSAVLNLKNEGIDNDKIYFVGDIMIDSLLMCMRKIKKVDTYKKYNLSSNNFAVLTLHRPSNVDSRKNFENIIEALMHIQKKIKVIFPIHPRTNKKMQKFNLKKKIKHMSNVITTRPLGYIDFMNLVLNCKFILTDSGSIQSESTYLDIPCITIREETERPATVLDGTNRIAGREKKEIIKLSEKALKDGWKKKKTLKYYDGKTAKRIVKILVANS